VRPPEGLRRAGGGVSLSGAPKTGVKGYENPGVSCESGNRTGTRESGLSKASAFTATAATKTPEQTDKKTTKMIARVLRWRALR
jgi:hypothetical protein